MEFWADSVGYTVFSGFLFLGCDVTSDPSEEAQRHPLHHWQRASARLLQWQRPRLSQSWWRDAPIVPSHWTGGLLQGEGPEPRSKIHDVNIKMAPFWFDNIINIFSILPQQPVVRGGPLVAFLWLPLTASQTAFATATAAMPGQWGRCVCWWAVRRPPPLWAT